MTKSNRFSQTLSVFRGIHLPEQDVRLAGYSAITQAFDLKAPLPDSICAISHKHSNYQQESWRMFTPRYTPEADLFSHLRFALKYEGVDLAILKALFNCIEPTQISQSIQSQATGSYSRRIWFLYEWLQQTALDIEDARKGNYVDALNPTLQYPGPTRLSKRHLVRNNLPGVPGFCPTIRCTDKLDNFIALHLDQKAQQTIGAIHPDILMRAAAFLLLKDSKASYAIEGETPPLNRAERWGKALGQAGKHVLSEEELLRLQKIVIGDFRFIFPGYRHEGGFIGEHERGTGYPLPEHISARADDLPELVEGLLATNELLKESDLDSVLAAAIIAFGFVFIHPFEDGNGRIHRYLIHHVLAKKNFTPKNMVFPISSIILERIDQYRTILESYSSPRLELIKWQATGKGNVEVVNETIDLYRYFDATRQAEFLYECIQETIEKTLPDEINYLKHYDMMKEFVISYIEMPDRLADLLIRFLNQNNGKFSKRALKKEFYSLTTEEIVTLEEKYADIFSGE